MNAVDVRQPLILTCNEIKPQTDGTFQVNSFNISENKTPTERNKQAFNKKARRSHSLQLHW